MTPLSARAIELAESYIGTHEIPPGSNRGTLIDAWLRRRHLDPAAKPWPWCAAFVSACVEDAANELHMLLKFRRSARCAVIVELNQDLWLPGPEPGAVFVHLNPDGTGHAGLVRAVHADGSHTGPEGNTDAAGGRTGGQVMIQTRPSGYAGHFIRIA